MARPILKDRYLRLGEARPLREVRISEALRKLGIATPEIVASATYSRGPFVRAELLTRYVDGSTTLGAEMDAGDGIDRAAAGLLSVGVLLVGMARAGLHHPDLHPGNVLISRDPSGPKAWILDLDRCSLQPERSPERVLDGHRSRLLRALYKWARVRRTTLHPELHTALETGIQAGSR
jgi:predicted unusual protein kinase regulating ubiquinone biosynthesis (AarF/ABC1/UbiB family)